MEHREGRHNLRGSLPGDEVVRWRAYPSWNQFAWLYFFSMMAAFRGLLFLKFDLEGGEGWLGGAVILLGCPAFLRRWAEYLITSRRLLIRNGYTGRVIQSLMVEDIREVTIRQGPIAQFLGIGALVIRFTRDETLTFKGIKDPEAVKSRIEALRA
jgi:hypothetical protein